MERLMGRLIERQVDDAFARLKRAAEAANRRNGQTSSADACHADGHITGR